MKIYGGERRRYGGAGRSSLGPHPAHRI